MSWQAIAISVAIYAVGIAVGYFICWQGIH